MTTISAGSAFYKVQNALDSNSSKVARSMERLATGQRGISAGDRPSSTMIANTLKGTAASIKIGIQNGTEALQAIEVMNNDIKLMGNIMVRLEELNALGGNALNTTNDKVAIGLEATDLKAQYSNLQVASKWAGTAMTSTTTIKFGRDAGSLIIGMGTAASITTTATAISTGTNGGASKLKVDKKALDVKLVLGAQQYQQMTDKLSQLTSLSAGYALDISSKLDVDFAAETTELAKGQILAQAGTAMLAQANAQGQGMLALIQS